MKSFALCFLLASCGAQALRLNGVKANLPGSSRITGPGDLLPEIILGDFWEADLADAKERQVGYVRFSEEKFTVASELINLPTALYRHNLVLAGDSNDRNAFFQICEDYGGKYADSMVMNSNDGLASNTLYATEQGVGQHNDVCHFPQTNTSMIYLWFDGALSSEPEPKWHHFNAQRAGWMWHTSANTKVNDCVIFARRHWTQAVRDLARQQLPIIFVTQSSLWDSVIAYEFLSKHSKPLALDQKEDLSTYDWLSADGIAAWRWKEHATELVSAVQNNGMDIKHMIWRTNSNCPPDDSDVGTFLNEVAEQQASAVRDAIAKKEDHWANVQLWDWRSQLNAKERGYCNEWHYTRDGYRHYMESLWRLIGTLNVE